MHVEYMRGTLKQNDAYCSKQGTLFEFGNRPAQGVAKAGSKSQEMFEELKSGKLSEYDAFHKYGYTFARNYKAYAYCKRLAPEPKPYCPKEVVLLWGKTGSGKSRRARKFFQDNSKPFFVKQPMTGKWWDGYCNEEGIIIEEFDHNQIEIEHLLVLLDVYPCVVEVKNGTMNFAPTQIVITSQTHYDDWYPFKAQDKKDALARRITSNFNLD